MKELKKQSVYPPFRVVVEILILLTPVWRRGENKQTRVGNGLCFIAVKPGPQSLSSPERKQPLAFIEPSRAALKAEDKFQPWYELARISLYPKGVIVSCAKAEFDPQASTVVPSNSPEQLVFGVLAIQLSRQMTFSAEFSLVEEVWNLSSLLQRSRGGIECKRNPNPAKFNNYPNAFAF